MAKEFLHKEGLTKLVENIKAWSKGVFLGKDATITKSSGTNKGVSVSIQGSVSEPSVSVSVTTGGVSGNNSGIVSGVEVKTYVDENAATKDTFKAATSSSNAVNGLVPAPSSANATKFLRGDGTWAFPKEVDVSNSSATLAWDSAVVLATVNGTGITAKLPKNPQRTYLTGEGLYESTANTFAVKAATSSSIGGLKTGYAQNGKRYPVHIDINNDAYVEVPWSADGGNAAHVGGKDVVALQDFMFKGDTPRYIPIDTDLDTLYGYNKCGCWNSYDNVEYPNCPEMNFGLLVLRINTSYFAQLLLPFDTGSATDVIRYRSQYYDGKGIKWNAWRKIARDEDLTQLISRIESGEIVAGNALCSARYTDRSNENGYILVRLNNITAEYMMSISVKIYDQYYYREFVFTGYAYRDVNTWYVPKCVLQCSIDSDTFGHQLTVHVGGTVSDGLWLAVKRYGYVSVDVSFNTAGFQPDIITSKDAFTISSVSTLPSDALALTAVTTTYTDTDIVPISASNKGVSVALGGTVGAPTVSVTTTTGGVSAANSGVVSGAEVKDYLETYTAPRATTADSANAIGGKGLNDLVQGGGTIKFIKVVTSLPASPSNDTLYLIKQ